MCHRPLVSEKDLYSFERFAVEEKVKDVMEQLITKLLHSQDRWESGHP
jgi:hypothetical protein